MSPDSHIRSPNNSTINNSWVSSTLLSPCSHSVNRLALNTEGAHTSRAVQLLQYFAKPIDSVIQAVAMIAFTSYDHFRDISYDIKASNTATVIVKSLLTPVSLPLKLFCASILSFGFLSGGAFQLLIPYQTIYSVLKGKQAAQFYFYENEIWRTQFDHESFRMKPITILNPFKIDETNQFWNERKKLLDDIDGPLRKRIGSELNICKAYPEYKELSKNRDNYNKFILKNVLSQDEKVKESLRQDKESLNKLEEIESKIEIANRRWRQIDSISLGMEYVINDGIPLGAKVEW